MFILGINLHPIINLINSPDIGAILFYKPFNYSPILTLLTHYLCSWYTYLPSTYSSALNSP